MTAIRESLDIDAIPRQKSAVLIDSGADEYRVPLVRNEEEQMALFGVIARKAPVGITADEFQERLAKGFTYTKDLVDRGIIKHRWILVGASAGLNIYEVGSHEELMSTLYNSPVGPHLQFEVYPLIEPADYDPTAYAVAAAQESSSTEG